MAGPDDILYDASVRDNTKTFFDTFDKRVTDLANRTSAGFAKVEGAIGGIGKTAGMIGGVIGGITGAISSKATTKIFELLDGFQQFAAESAQVRARGDELAVVLDTIGKNAGYSKDELAKYEEELRATGVSILATRQSMAQWIQQNLDLSKASKIARVAQDAATIGQINSSEAFQRITNAIVTMQPEMLRSLGIQVNMQEMTARLTDASGKRKDALSIEEKQQLMMNAVIEKGKNIAGAYEAAMGSVSKKMRSMERVNEDLRYAFGAVFQPVMKKNVDAMYETLVDLTDYLEKHEEDLISLGETVAAVFGTVLTVLLEIGKLLITMPQKIKDVSMGIAQLLSGMSDEEIEKRAGSLGDYFQQASTLLIGFLKVGVDLVVAMFEYAGRNLITFRQLVSGKLSIEEYMQKNTESMEKFKAAVRDTMETSMIEAAKFTGVIKDVEIGTDKAADAMVKFGSGLAGALSGIADFAEFIGKANESLGKFYYSLQQDILEQQIKAMRDAIESALQESYRLEDLAKKHADAVAQIMEGADESRKEAMKQHSEAKLEIEKNYQRRLRDIQSDFEYSAEELSRARDAIGLMRLMRQKDRELKEAATARDDAKTDSNEAYQKQLQTLDQQRQKALEDLAKQEAKEEESYQQSLKRQEELQKLHDQWEKEDRDRKNAQRLADLLENFTNMEGSTEEGLASLYALWEGYFGNLLTLAQTKQAELETYTNIGTGGTTTPSGTAPTPNMPGHQGGLYQPGVIGQSGQVSQLLASPAMLSPQMTLPRIQPESSSSGRQALDVTVKGEAMDPYIQRQLALALMEIERNRGIQSRYPV